MLCVTELESPLRFSYTFGYKTYMAVNAVNKSLVRKMYFLYVSFFYSSQSALLQPTLLCFIPPCTESHLPLILPSVFYME